MRVSRILLETSKSIVMDVSFRDTAPTAPYVVTGMFGLDADEIVPRFSGFSLNNTKEFSFGLAKRDIVLRIAFNPRNTNGKSYSELRDDLYRIIEGSRDGLVSLRFLNDCACQAVASGYITKFEALILDQKPEVQITISCDDPMLRAPNPYEVDIFSLDMETTISDRVSTAKHGLNLSLTFLGAATSFTIRDQDPPTWKFVVSPIGGFLNGDILQLSSEFKKKYVSLKRGSTEINLLDRVSVESTWPIICPGENDFEFVVTPDTTSFTWNYFNHRPAYWGV